MTDQLIDEIINIVNANTNDYDTRDDLKKLLENKDFAEVTAQFFLRETMHPLLPTPYLKVPKPEM